MLFQNKYQPIAMRPRGSICILADRFLRNSANRVDREALLTSWCLFPSKRRFGKSKNTEVA